MSFTTLFQILTIVILNQFLRMVLTRGGELMLDLNRELETALVVVTHDLEIAAHMQHQWRMQDGLLAPET